MDAKTLIEFLLNSSNLSGATVSDPYWNDVKLLMRLDKEANTRGLPLYRDYSRYQYPVREFYGAAASSRIQFLDNPTQDLPAFPNNGDVDVKSFCYIPNKHNFSLRQAELNINPNIESRLEASHFEFITGGLDDLDLGTGDFTIEFSFFADEVALPWRWQTIWMAGNACLAADFNNDGSIPDLKTYIVNNAVGSFSVVTPSGIPLGAGEFTGWGCFLKDNNLVFSGKGFEYQINTAPVQKLTWYHVCIQRTNSKLEIYLNTNRTLEVPNFTATLSTSDPGNLSFNNKIRIGCSPLFRGSGISGMYLYTPYNAVDTAFSGGISNFRITAKSRYPSTFYTLKLPFPTLAVDNKIDDKFSDVLVNLPISYDHYNYSPNRKHFANRQYLKGIPNFQTGFLPITGYNSYETENLGVNLNSNQWTLEFFICKTLNNSIYYETPYSYGYTAIGLESSFGDWLYEYRIREIANQDFTTSINLISLRSNGKKVLDVNLEVVASDSTGAYFSVKASTDGETWINLPFDENINWNENVWNSSPYLLPNNEIKFYPSSPFALPSGLTQNPDPLKNIVPSGYSPTPKHIAVSRLNNLLYLLVDGEVIKSVPFPYTLYQFTNNLTLTLCGDTFTDIIGSKTTGQPSVTLGVALKGVRLTNTARYSFNTVNDVQYLNSVQPLPLSSGVIPPSRARVIDLVKTDTKQSVSTATVSWEVFLSQPVDGLVIADFTLSGEDGISGFSLASISKQSEYKYLVVANTGIGNGKLTLNFIDRRTVRYKDSSEFISYFAGELSIEGETYNINKNAPVPILTSGVNPYISTPFTVRLSFDAAVATVDISRLGLENARVSNVLLIDEVNHVYDIRIEPIAEGIVRLQAMEGLAVTDSNIPSTQSLPFVRIFSSSFAILQTPLNLTTTVFDLSPSRIVLDDVVDNNTQYSTTIAPVGENSSLYVNPFAEQSGLRYPNFNAVGSTVSVSQQEWTIEFFLRINSTQGFGKAHILSVENASTGFCIFAEGGKLRLQRSVTNTNNLLGSTVIDEIETPTYVDWNDTEYTRSQKYPHFAITYRQGVYRVYRNGSRIDLVQSSNLIDISKGDLYVGYYPNRIDDVDYWLSNVRLTLGKALYTSAFVNIPGLPYTVLPNILDATQLLNYISIISDNLNGNVASAGNTITLKFNSIVNLQTTPVVTILDRAVALTKNGTEYTATVTVLSTDTDGQAPFSITISGEIGIPTKTFTNTTNNSQVFVDNTPLSSSISSDSPNNNSYIIEAHITFTEAVQSFDISDLTATNCRLGNLRQIPNTNRYLFTVTASSSGSIAVQLGADRVKDLAGNFNVASNTFVRTVIVPAYIPDPNFNNVLLLLQPETTVVDESLFNTPLTLNNITLSNSNAPQGLTKSIEFNGQDSSIQLNLSSTLASTEAYTVEFFAYFKSSVVFRLARPKVLPASQISSNSFTANWDKVDNASDYVIDVSRQANFTTTLTGYRNLQVGNVSTFSIKPTKSELSPTSKSVRLKSSKGFVGEWQYPLDALGFKYDVALDNNFTQKLYLYSDKLSEVPYAEIGNITNSQWIEPSLTPSEPDVPDTGVPYNPKSGVLVTGLLSNANYPRVFYFLEESTVRLYPKDGYVLPAIAEDIDPLQWHHIAIVNDVKYTYLYANGEQVDKVRNTGFSSQFDVGYSIGNFFGSMTGLRITKGVKRYTGKTYTVPTLPYSKN